MLKKVNSRAKLNRRQQRDLDIEIGFLERVIQRDPRYVEALQALGADYTNRGKFDDGLKIDKQNAGTTISNGCSKTLICRTSANIRCSRSSGPKCARREAGRVDRRFPFSPRRFIFGA